jgi:signal transduction histidine kinase
MTPFRARLSGVTLLAGVVLLLVPLLAWLQYRWLGQVSDAERDRMQRTLRTAASQFGVDFDGELSRTMVGVQVDGPTMRDQNWTAYAQKYSAWTERTQDPRLVREVLLVDVPGRARGSKNGKRVRGEVLAERLRLRHWNDEQRTFEVSEWTGELSGMREILARHMGEIRELRMQDGERGRMRREAALSFMAGDDYTLIAPVTLFEFPEDRHSRPRIDILGFTLVRFDPDYIRGTLLPMLAARHFHGGDASADYRLAVTDRDDPSRTIWESDEGAAAAIGRSPDVTHSFMSARPDQLFMVARNGGTSSNAAAPGERIMISVLQDRRVPPPPSAGGTSAVPEPPRGYGAFEGRWQLAAVHRAGSLEAAVTAVRRRNLMLSSGILILLTTAIGLIVVSARRAQTLARQQMEFVAAVSHELRTPVSVIGTAAGNLADGVVEDPARVRVYGETIQAEARRLAETVERVLQLAGIAAGRAAAARVQIGAGDLIEHALKQCSAEIAAAGVDVEVAVADNLPPVEGDAAALGAALQNLVSNAIKYGGEARWLKVGASGNPEGLPLQRSRRGDPSAFAIASADRRSLGGGWSGLPSQIAFAVSDRGFGIGAEDRKHIFEPFYRGREAVARQIQGSGLGLNLVQRIAEAHQGHVTVTSELGKGSTFTLVLPAASPTPSGSPATPGREITVAASSPLQNTSPS